MAKPLQSPSDSSVIADCAMSDEGKLEQIKSIVDEILSWCKGENSRPGYSDLVDEFERIEEILNE